VGNRDSADAGASKRFGFGLPKATSSVSFGITFASTQSAQIRAASTRLCRGRAAMAPPTPSIPPVPPIRGRRSPAGEQAPPDRFAGMEGSEVRSDQRPDHGERRSSAEDGVATTVSPDGAPAGRPLSEVPFAWQHGRRLLLLDEESRGWTFAEFRFDQERCRYVEVRRATFRWPREAAGALLAHGVSFGDEQTNRLAAALDRWLATHASVVASQGRAGGE
jgi:hypothetical protein